MKYKWIPIQSRKPKSGREVLVLNLPTGATTTARYHPLAKEGWKWGGLKWVITHWMYVPGIKYNGNTITFELAEPWKP